MKVAWDHIHSSQGKINPWPRTLFKMTAQNINSLKSFCSTDGNEVVYTHEKSQANEFWHFTYPLNTPSKYNCSSYILFGQIIRAYKLTQGGNHWETTIPFPYNVKLLEKDFNTLISTCQVSNRTVL